MPDKPLMTAQQLQREYPLEQWPPATYPEGESITLRVSTIDFVLRIVVALLAAREREAAELAEMRRQIGEMGKRLQDDGR